MSEPHHEKILFTEPWQIRRSTSNGDYGRGLSCDTTKLFLNDKSLEAVDELIKEKFVVRNSFNDVQHSRKNVATALQWVVDCCSSIRALLVRGQKPEDLIVPVKALLPHESAYMHNYTRSSFHKLPMELILEITDQLGPVARLIMQRVCSRFRRALTPYGTSPELESNTMTRRNIFQFAMLLRQDLQQERQDDYDQECDLELLKPTIYYLGCSGCRTSHDIENYSANQLSLPSKIRICKDLEASFQLCAHHSFSGMCLLQGLRQLKHAELFCRAEMFSQAGHTQDIYGRRSSVLGRRSSGPCVGFHRGPTITIDQVIPLLVVEENDEAPHHLLSFVLRQRRAYICPHLNSSSPELFGGRQLTAECPNYTFAEIRILERDNRVAMVPCHSYDACCQLRFGRCVIWAQRPHPDCLTRYCLRRIGWPRYSIILEVSRDLVGGPAHPAWLAQMEQETVTGKAETDRIMACENGTSIPLNIASLSMGNGYLRNTNNLGIERYKCKARFKTCTPECALTKYSSFINS